MTQAYYTTSYAFGNSTTSTTSLLIWQALSEHLEQTQMPMTAEELFAATGVAPEVVDAIFVQSYYQRFYGFRRFDTLDQWRQWAESTGVLYNSALHHPPVTEEPEPELEPAEADVEA